MLDVFKELELAVCAFAQYWRAKGFHNLLDRDRCTGELILR